MEDNHIGVFSGRIEETGIRRQNRYCEPESGTDAYARNEHQRYRGRQIVLDGAARDKQDHRQQAQGEAKPVGMPGGVAACQPEAGQRRYDRRCRLGHDHVTEYAAGHLVTPEAGESPIDYWEGDEDKALGKCGKADITSLSCGRQAALSEPRQDTLDPQRLSVGPAGLHRILALPRSLETSPAPEDHL